MVKGVLVDTSLIIDHLRLTFANPETETIFAKILEENKVFLCGLALTELYAGQSSKITSRRKKLEETISKVKIILPDERNYKKAGTLVRDHPNTEPLDCLIAATCIQNNVPLATLNPKHFYPLKELALFPLPT